MEFFDPEEVGVRGRDWHSPSPRAGISSLSAAGRLGRFGFENLPVLIGRAGAVAGWRFVEFFAWCERHGIHTLEVAGSTCCRRLKYTGRTCSEVRTGF